MKIFALLFKRPHFQVELLNYVLSSRVLWLKLNTKWKLLLRALLSGIFLGMQTKGGIEKGEDVYIFG